MRCSEIEAELSAYLDGELAGAQSRWVAGHLAECAGCARELDSLRAVVSWTGRIPEAEPPAYLHARILRALTPAPATAFQRAWAAIRGVTSARPLIWAACGGAAVALALSFPRPETAPTAPLASALPSVATAPVEPAPAEPLNAGAPTPEVSVKERPAMTAERAHDAAVSSAAPPRPTHLVLRPPTPSPAAEVRPPKPLARRPVPLRPPPASSAREATAGGPGAMPTPLVQPRGAEPPASRPGDPTAPRPMAAAPADSPAPAIMGMTTEPPKMAGMMTVPVMMDDDGLEELRQFLEQNKTGGSRKPDENLEDGSEAESAP